MSPINCHRFFGKILRIQVPLCQNVLAPVSALFSHFVCLLADLVITISGSALVSYLLKKFIKTKHFQIKPKVFIICNKKATLKPCEGKPELNSLSNLILQENLTKEHQLTEIFSKQSQIFESLRCQLTPLNN